MNGKQVPAFVVVKVQKEKQTNERSLARSDRARGEKERSVIRIMFLMVDTYIGPWGP